MDYVIEKAQNLLKELNVNCFPIKLKAVCTYLDIELTQAFLGEKDGVLLRSRDKNLIIVNKQHNVQRKRFSTAHEIGHFVDGHESVSFSDGFNSWNERIANIFASELLMPTKYLLHTWTLGRLIPQFVATAFNVSQQAASIAIEHLYERHPEILTKNMREIKLLKAEYDCSFEMSIR